MKRFVWPALKALIAVIVAIALVKIAFFPSQNDSATADISPGYSANVNTVSVAKGNIANKVEVKGRIVQDATVEVQADLAGVVDSVAVEKDAQVSAGDPLLYISTPRLRARRRARTERATSPRHRRGQGHLVHDLRSR